MVQAILGEGQGAALTVLGRVSRRESLCAQRLLDNQMWEEGPAPTHRLTGVGPPADRAFLSGSLHSKHLKRTISV